ncbi:MAG: ACT domain-containing protein [bacterium]|nr:ACT domain-containing protein [bacterium]
MSIQQISVFLENKKGRLAEVTELLSGSGINIRALALADTTDFGVLRMIVNDYKKCQDILKKHGFIVRLTDVIGVEVEDRPGGLNRVMQLFNSNNVNIEYMYAFVEKKKDNAVVVFRIDDMEKAKKVLKENKINIFSAEL